MLLLLFYWRCCCCCYYLILLFVERWLCIEILVAHEQYINEIYSAYILSCLVRISRKSDIYEIGPVGGFEWVAVCVIFVGAAVVNLVSVSWEAFAFKIVFSTSNWFIRSISSDIFSFNTSTSSRTANIKCDFTRSYFESRRKNKIKGKKLIRKIIGMCEPNKKIQTKSTLT